MTDPIKLADELERLAKAATQTDDDIRYYSGGSKYNEAREKLTSLIECNLATITGAIRREAALREALQHVTDCLVLELRDVLDNDDADLIDIMGKTHGRRIIAAKIRVGQARAALAADGGA